MGARKAALCYFVLTGAGVSAESGLGTFRDQDGLWTKYDLAEVATPEGYARDPQKVIDFYNARRANAADAVPNAAHDALATLGKALGNRFSMITQNVDSLHEKAGSHEVIHMHGALDSALCAQCGHRWASALHATIDDYCPACGAQAVRPDIVWFGEMPYHMDTIERRLIEADVFVAIGTSGEVYPAAGFVETARRLGLHTIEINLEPSAGARLFDENRYGPASTTVPAWVDEVLGTSS